MKLPIISLHQVSFSYPEAEKPVLKEIDLEIFPGELVLVTGPSGGGKSTLLRCLNGLVPHFTGGEITGELSVAGKNPVDSGPARMSNYIGFVFQDPETQFVLDQVEDEIALALENAALPVDEILHRIDQVLQQEGINHLRGRNLDTLSGGERQRVAVACALALLPPILVLDEPTSQLDPASANELLEYLVGLKHKLGLTIVIAEHRLERILPFTDRFVYLDREKPGLLNGPPRQVLSAIPTGTPVVQIGKHFGWEPLPLSIDEAQPYVPQVTRRIKIPNVKSWHADIPAKTPLLKIEEVTVRIGNQIILTDVNLDLYKGEILALLGPNGAGKTTLVRSIVGLQPIQSGRILIHGVDVSRSDPSQICRKVAYLPQDPNSLLFADSVLEELAITLRNHHLSTGVYEPDALLEKLGLAGLAQAYPRDLSAGERQRVALGAVTVTRPVGLLLDEPTRGLDWQAKTALTNMLKDYRASGMAILVITHDVELAVELADRISILDKGKVIAQGDPYQVLSKEYRFQPQMLRLFPDHGWLTVEQVCTEGQAI